MNPPRVYTISQSWIPLPPPTPYHLSGSSPCTSPKHPFKQVKSFIWKFLCASTQASNSNRMSTLEMTAFRTVPCITGQYFFKSRGNETKGFFCLFVCLRFCILFPFLFLTFTSFLPETFFVYLFKNEKVKLKVAQLCPLFATPWTIESV